MSKFSRLNRWQMSFLIAFAEGEYRHLTGSEYDAPEDAREKELDSIGDSFVRAALIELATSEGCESWQDAIARIRRVGHEFIDAASCMVADECCEPN